MSLINCPDCGYQVSNNAECCPKCGYPIAGNKPIQANSDKIQTIEQTSKKYKLQQLLSSLLVIGSVIVLIVDSSGNKPTSGAAAFGILGLIVGFIWFIVVRFLTWWHHG